MTLLAFSVSAFQRVSFWPFRPQSNLIEPKKFNFVHQKSGQTGKPMVKFFSAVAADVRRLTSSLRPFRRRRVCFTIKLLFQRFSFFPRISTYFHLGPPPLRLGGHLVFCFVPSILSQQNGEAKPLPREARRAQERLTKSSPSSCRMS